jgi:site-specific recombinase XerD
LPHLPGQPATNAGLTFPPEVLSNTEEEALLAGCSPTAPTGIRNRALIWVLYGSGVGSQPVSLSFDYLTA